jgi:hypothetical protein
MLAHFLDEERRDAWRLRRLAARDDRLLLGFVGLRLRDVPFVGHPLQHDVAPGDRALHVDVRALALGKLKQTGDQRRFLEGELLVRLVEVQPRRRLDPVGAVREIHLVAVDREDLLFRVPLLDLNREDDFLDLPLQRLGKALLTLGGEPELVFQVAGQLLRQRAGALRPAALEDVDRAGHGDAPDVDAEVAIELGVLGRDNPLTEQRVDVIVPDDDPPLRRELADHLAVRGVDARDRAGRVVVEHRDARQIACVREQHPAQDAEHPRDHEERDDAGIPSDADDVVGHGIEDFRLKISD